MVYLQYLLEHLPAFMSEKLIKTKNLQYNNIKYESIQGCVYKIVIT